jgi:integrase
MKSPVKKYPRYKTKYPGVFYRIGKRLGKKGQEKIYYVVIKKNGQVLEEKIGRQYANQMTPAKASGQRLNIIEGRKTTKRELKKRTKWTFDLLWETYKKHYSLSRKQKNPSRNLRSDSGKYTNHLKRIIGSKEPQELTPHHISIIEAKTSHLSPGTQKHVLALVKRISNFASKRGLCPGINIHIELPRVNNEVTEDLTPAQLGRLIKTLNESSNKQVATMLRMVLLSGMRRGELCKLQWDDIDWQNRFVHIRGPKGGVDQKIPINDSAYELLYNYPRTTSKFIFPGKKGKQLINPNEAAKKIMLAADLPYTFRPFHGLRHVYASMLASSGKVDIYTLQRLLTHKTPKMTQRYAHLRDDVLKNAAAVASDIIGEAMQDKGKKRAGK